MINNFIALPNPARRSAASLYVYIALQVCTGAIAAECDAGACGEEVSMLQTAHHVSGRTGYSSRRSFVKKTHFSDTTRFVFVAGIEGSGHHAWQEMLNYCESSGGPCADVGLETRELLWGKSWKGGLFQYIFKDSQERDDVTDRFVGSLRRLARNATSPTLYGLNTMSDTEIMMSYPTGGEPDKDLHHPDLHLLAELAERAEVDLRILVLQRDPTDILLSTVYNREFSPLPREALVLTDNAYVLHGQLSSVDKRFMKCARLSPSQSGDLPTFLHPTFSGEHKQVWGSMLQLVKTPSRPASKPEMVEFVSQLSAATDRIDAKCNAA